MHLVVIHYAKQHIVDWRRLPVQQTRFTNSTTEDPETSTPQPVNFMSFFIEDSSIKIRVMTSGSKETTKNSFELM